MKFRTREAGEHWRDWEWLAGLCAHAELSVEQAEATLLVARGYRLEVIAVTLAARTGRALGYRQAHEKAREAERKLKRARPDLVAAHRCQMRDLLTAMRNIRSPSQRLALYRERWWGHDREPISFVSRLDGETPEDLMRRPLRFLRDLPRLCESPAVRV